MDTPSATANRLFQEHGAAVYRFAAVMLKHPQDSEDVLQETFLKLLQHLQRGGSTENIRGWLFTVAAHAARDRQRRRMRWLPWTTAQESSVEPPALWDEDGRLRAARDAMLRLPSRDRLLITLRAGGLSYQEIARASGVRYSSVGRLLARALDRWARASNALAPLANQSARELVNK